MIDKVLAAIRLDTSFLSFYTQGMSALYNSKVFELLKEFGRSRIIGTGSNVQEMATQAAWSAGYNQALEDLLFFRERFLDTAVTQMTDTPDYGGIEMAYEKGDLMKEEIDAIRTGTAPVYPKPKPATAGAK